MNNDNDPLPAFNLIRGSHGLVPKYSNPGSMALARSALANRPRASVVFCLTRADTGLHLCVKFKAGHTKLIENATWAESPANGYVLYTITSDKKKSLERKSDCDLSRELAKLANSICPKGIKERFRPGDIKLEIVAV